jgi:hypothetical protein
MSSPFQQKFSAKNPVKTFTLKQLERQAKKDDKEMYKNAALLPQINQGDYDYESEDEQKFPGDDSYTYEKKTQVKSDSPLDMYAYVSTAPHFQRLQDNIARAFSQTGGKTKKEKETEFKAETEKVSEKLKETTDKGFKDYSAKADFNSKSGSVFDKDENNYFNKYGQ